MGSEGHAEVKPIRVGGIVLCGGQSSRMGRPKAWLPFGDELLLQRVVRLLGTAVRPVVVVAAPDQDVPPLPGDIRIVRDAQPGRGPLQGLAAGLEALRGLADVAYVSSCDAPFLNPAFVNRLIDLLGDNAAAVPYVNGYHHTLAAVYRVEVAEAVNGLLVEDRLRSSLLLEVVPTRIVTVEDLVDFDPLLRTLRNLNTPEEYVEALRDL
jgi:molybdopterin-guanine dinucleotide biosynthesis protein A